MSEPRRPDGQNARPGRATMATYAVFEPPLRGSETAPAPERFAFVRDGFHFWAFLLTPLWLLWHRLWLCLIGYVVLVFGLEYGVQAATGSEGAAMAAGLLLSLLAGLEAATLRRWTLLRRKWREVAHVVADSQELAERWFFAARFGGDGRDPDIAGQGAVPPPGAPGTPLGGAASAYAAVPRPPSDPGVIGLFPQPGGGR